MIPPRDTMFSTPTWLRDLGFASWLLVGFVLIIGVIWLLGESRVASRPRVGLAAAARLDRLRSQERSVRGRDAEAVEVRQHGAAQVDR
ncbi:MAG TPA: hypothetical protein VEX12_07180 [Microbacterium sp.]|nr:hypothetical protein [Microbacterium sp.]